MVGQTVDIHAHALAEGVDAMVAKEPGHRQEIAHSIVQFGEQSQAHNLRLVAEQWLEQLTSLDARLATMDAAGIDVQAVSPTPTQYHYWANPGLSAELVEAVNEAMARLVSAAPDRLVGLGSVSLQHPELAATQVERAVQVQGLKGVEISSHAGGLDFSDPAYEPLWEAAEATGAVLFLHPLGCTLDARLQPFYLGNVIGQPLETTIALSHLIFAGVLDRHPRMRIVAAHGGGYLPHYCSRADHAWEVRPESQGCLEPPSRYLDRLWYDSLVYQPGTLGRLVDAVGAHRIVLGTDHPFDMGVTDPLERLAAVPDLSDTERSAIAGDNAAELLGLPRGSRPR